MNVPSEFLVPYLASNLIALVLIFLAWRSNTVARFAFALIFLAASIANSLMVIRDPTSYVEGYGGFAFLGFYKSFIYGVFSRHTIPIVLAIAAGQFLLSVLFVAGGRYLLLAAVGACTFFFAITPLGVGAAFPSSLLAIAALIVLIRQPTHKWPTDTAS